MTWFAIGYQCALEYVVALMIYQFGTLFTTGAFGVGTVAAIDCVVFIVYMLFIKKPYSPQKEMKKDVQHA